MTTKKTKLMKFFNFLPSLIRYVILIYITLALGLCVLTSWFFGPLLYAEFTKFNLLFFLIALIFLVSLMFVGVFIIKKEKLKNALCKNSTFNYLMVVSFIIIFAVQMFIISFIYYLPVFDVLNMTFYLSSPTGEISSFINEQSNLLSYFQSYTDRWFLTGIFFQIYNALNGSGIANWITTSFLGLGSESGSGAGIYFILETISSLFVSISTILVAFIGKKLGGPFVGYLAIVFSFFLVNINPLAGVPYSDTFGMVFVVFSLFSYVCINNKPLKFFLITCSGIFGYCIKPTAIAITAAIVFIEICKLLGSAKINYLLKSINWKKFVCSFLSVIVAIAIAFPIVSVVSNFGVPYDPEKEFTYTHFLMMGANKDTSGQFDTKDEEFSNSFKTKAEREKANLNKWTERISSQGIIGNLEHLAKKTITNCGCGNFLQTNSVSFSQPYKHTNVFLRIFYNVGDENTDFIVDGICPYNCFCQIFWITTLIGFIFFAYKRKSSKYTDAMIISLWLLLTFLLFAESSQRYVYIYALYFILLAALGIKEMFESYIIFYNKRKTKIASET